MRGDRVYIVTGWNEATGAGICHPYVDKKDADQKLKNITAGIAAVGTDASKLHVRVVTKVVK